MAVNREIRFTFTADTKQLDKAYNFELAKLNELKASQKEQAKQDLENSLLELKNKKLKGKAYDEELLSIRRNYRAKISEINKAYDIEKARINEEKRLKDEELKATSNKEKQALKEQQQHEKQANKELIEKKKQQDKDYIEWWKQALKEKDQQEKQALKEQQQQIKEKEKAERQAIKDQIKAIKEKEQAEREEAAAAKSRIELIIKLSNKLRETYKKVAKELKTISTNVRNAIYKGVEKTISAIIKLVVGMVATITALLTALYKLADYGGDLQAANNMVAQSFGDMTSELEGFCNVAKETYGLTETMAKKTAGLFMNMSNSMGIARSEGEKMALSLAALSGDMASFYNKDQNDIMLALKSVYTGETETLKNYAIVLTEANLEQYMLEKGIKASYQEMNQAEKTLLRYAYVMETTTAVQGNFARTGDNYVTTLASIKAELGKLLEILGKVAIQLLTPMLKVVSVIITKLQVMAQVLSDCLQTMFGLVATSGVMGVDNTLFDWDNEEDQANKTIDSIKSKMQSLAGVDTINTLQEPSSSKNGGLGSIETYEKLKTILETLSNYKTGLEKGIDKSKFSWVETLMQWIKDRVENAKYSFQNAFANIDFGPLKESWGQLSEQLGPFIDWLIDKLAIVSAWFIEHILPHLLDIGDALLEIVPLIVDAIDWEWLGGIIESVLAFISDKLKEFKTWCEENPDALSNIMNLIIKIVGFIAFILPLLVDATTAFLTICEVVLFLATTCMPVLISTLSSIVGYVVSQFVPMIIKGIEICVEKLVSFGRLIGNVFYEVVQGIASMFNNIPNMIVAGLNLAIKMINTVLQAMNSIKFDIPDWVPEIGGKSFGFNMPQIPQLQSGGVFTQPNITQTSGKPTATTTSAQSSNSDNSGYFNEMISLLQTLVNKDSNTYIDGRQLNKVMSNVSNNEIWRRNATT